MTLHHRLLVVVIWAFLFLALVCAAERFDGVPLVRVELSLRGGDPDPCGDVRVAHVAPVSSRRSPHAWQAVAPSDLAPVTLASQTHTEGVQSTLESLARPPSSVTSPTSSVPTRQLRFIQDDTTYAFSFSDPRWHRLHGGHYETELSIDGRPRPKPILTWRAVLFGETPELDPPLDNVTVLPTASEAVYLPAEISSIELYCSSALAPDATLRLDPQPGRRIGTKSTDATPEVKTIYAAGPPDKTYNIIFVSGGYEEKDRDMFFANASNLSSILFDSSLDPSLQASSDDAIASMHRSVPFNRYWLNWNVYAVFQASAQTGANRPLIGLSVDNNLGCTHPKEMERAVYCDRSLSQALAAVSPGDVIGEPDRNIIVAIVNTHLYGGSAVSLPGRLHFANFFNGYDLSNDDERRRMLSLVNHELGHAFGELMDEYSIGVSEPTVRNFHNCENSLEGSLKWQHWIDAKNADPAHFRTTYAPGVIADTWGVLDTPEAVCGFTNYYKSNSNCMMHRLSDYFMCPVCREGSTQSVMGVRFDLEWPRRPLRDIVTVVLPSGAGNDTTSGPLLTVDDELVLHLANHLTRGYTVIMRDTDGTVLPLLHTDECYNCVVLNKTNFDKYPVDAVVSIHVRIEDSTDQFILEPNVRISLAEQLQQETTFRLVVASSLAAIQGQGKNLTVEGGVQETVVGTHSSDLQARYVFCEPTNATRDANDTVVCEMQFTSGRPYERPPDFDGFLSQFDAWVLWVLLATGLVLLLLWVWAAIACTDKSNATARSIFKTQFSCAIRFIRRIMLLSSVLFFTGAIIAISLGAYVYYDTTALGRFLLIAGAVLSLGMYLLAFIGFWSVMSRTKRMLVVNGVLLVLAMALLTFAFAVILSIGKELQAEGGFQIDFGDQFDPNGNNRTASSSSEEPGYWTKQLEYAWRDMVADDPETACAVQGMLKCSGYYTNCATDFASTAMCPRDCEATNAHFQSPCQTIIKDYVIEHYPTLAYVSGTAAFLLLTGVFLNFLLLGLMCCAKKQVQQDNTKRIDTIHRASLAGSLHGLPPSLHPSPHASGIHYPEKPTMPQQTAAVGVLAVGAAAAEPLATGNVTDPKAQQSQANNLRALFLLRSLDSTSTAALVREFKRIDYDGNGELDREELVHFFRKVLQYKPTAAEIDVIFQVADTDKSGTISFAEFLTIFGGARSVDDAENLMKSVHNPRHAPRAVGLQRLMSMGGRRASASGTGRGGSPRNRRASPVKQQHQTASGSASPTIPMMQGSINAGHWAPVGSPAAEKNPKLGLSSSGTVPLGRGPASPVAAQGQLPGDGNGLGAPLLLAPQPQLRRASSRDLL